MVTIAKTNKYHELVMRHLTLIQLYSSMSEIRLHTNKSVDSDLAKYYLNHVMNRHSGFFAPAIDSMRRNFYISLKALIGAYYDDLSGTVKCTKSDKDSIAKYLYDGQHKQRKKSAVKTFEKLIIDNANEFQMLKDLRDSVVHYDKKMKTDDLIIFGEAKTIEIINGIGDVLYLLGFRRWNSPHHFSYDNEYAKDVCLMIDSILTGDKNVKAHREKYKTKREEWIIQ